MRHWLAHPLILYPLMAAIAAALVFVSLRPDLAMGAAAAHSGRDVNGAVVLDGAALADPDVGPGQVAYVARDGLGRATALRIAVLPHQPPPGPADPGLRILLSPEAVREIGAGPVTLEISIRPVPITTAAALAATLEGAGPHAWQIRELSPQAQIVRYEFPSVEGLSAVGLRVVSAYDDYNYGFEIARIRLVPAAAAPAR